MGIETDILIDGVNKRVYQDHAYNPASDTEYKTQELYTLLMNWADNQENMPIATPMTAQTPNAYTLVNGWFIDDETVKWFDDGAIETSGWSHPTNPTGIRLLILASITGVDASDIGKVVAGVTTGDTGTLVAFNTSRKALWVRCDAADDLFDNASEDINVDSVLAGAMSGASISGENLYVNVYTLGTLTSSSDTIYLVQADEKLTAWWSEGITGFDVLVKVKEMGTMIDSGNIIVFCRYYPTGGNAALYDHFPITLTAGRQAVPLATALDLNNTSSQAIVADYLNGVTYTIIFGTSGPYEKTLGAVTKNYDVSINCDGAHVAEMYEACKYVCREGSTTQLFSDNGEEYIMAGSYSPVKASPLGTFAGGKFFGARGIWIENYHSDDAQLFQLISSDNTTVYPPNAVSCAVVALEVDDSVGMYMLVSSGGLIEKDTYTLDGDHAASATTVTVLENIAANWSGQDPPGGSPFGFLRVVKTDGSEVLASYTSWSGKVFTLSGTLGTACNNGDGVYVPILDKITTASILQNTLVKDVASTVYIRTVVRHYTTNPNESIIPWSQDTSIPNTGVTVNATRTLDGIVL